MKTIRITLNQQLRQNSILLVLASFAIGLLCIRAILTHSLFYGFLPWNLILAYIPLAITGYMINRPHLIEKKGYFYSLFFAWLMFLPNAPYILTDFLHFRRETTVPFWMDILMLISFSLSGVLFGIKSIKQMFYMLATRFSYIMVWIIVFNVCLLAGFGIYVGRFLRYNSWDVLHKPFSLIQSIFTSLTSYPECKTAWGVTLGFGVFLFLMFLMYPDTEN